jgi:hypothetical protein
VVSPFTGLPVILDNKERIIEFVRPDQCVHEERRSRYGRRKKAAVTDRNIGNPSRPRSSQHHPNFFLGRGIFPC